MSKLSHTYTTQSFAAEIVATDTVNKKLKLVATDYYHNFLNMKCEVGEKVTVIVTTKKPSRTSAQNSYYWGVYLPAIMAETGETDINALHELFKGTCLPSEIKVVLGKQVRIKKSTTDLSVSDFMEYIMRIEAMTEVMAPPVENFSLAPLRKPLTPVLHEKI